MTQSTGSCLAAGYDKLACELLAHSATASCSGLWDVEKLVAMARNFCWADNVHGPGRCDVLTTYLEVDGHEVSECLAAVADEVSPVLGADFDGYRVPAEDYHVSLVMLHDVRPSDMDDDSLTASVLSDDEIAEVKDAIAARLAAAELRHFDLSLYGIRISPADGAVMAVLIDQGETATLRSLLNQAVRPFIRPQQLKYPKPFIHVTLYRPLAQVAGDTAEALAWLQRRYFCLLQDPHRLQLRVDTVRLGRERLWMHREVDELSCYPIP